MPRYIIRRRRGRIRDTPSCVFAGTKHHARCYRPEARECHPRIDRAFNRSDQSRTATEDKGMKHLLNRVAIDAAPAIAAPMKPMATKKRAKRPVQHAARHGKSRRAAASSGDSMTNQLNRKELSRIQ